MSYQAIARKWRPQSFEEISGQSHVTRTLTNALKKGRIHHAFLFTGPRGVGKTTAARALARCLNCVDGPTPSPCGQCASCIEVSTGVSPDVVEIDGASNNSVENIRELRDSVQYLPARGKYRVYIIDEVHMLSKGAFNALLKTLEEPPAHVVFIFATTEPKLIPDTVRSRVQRFDFKRIPASVVAKRLAVICEAEGVEFSEASLRLIARAGEGSMRDSQSLLDQVIAFAGDSANEEEVAQILGMVDRSLLYQMLEGLLQGEPSQSLDAIATVYEHGYELSQFTSELLELLRNAALASMSPSSKAFLDISDDERSRVLELAENIRPEVFSRYFDVLMEVHDAVSKASRPRLVLEMAVARLSNIRDAQPIDDLLTRLEGLERRIRTAGAAPASPNARRRRAQRNAAPKEPLRSITTTTEEIPQEAPSPESRAKPESVADKPTRPKEIPAPLPPSVSAPVSLQPVSESSPPAVESNGAVDSGLEAIQEDAKAEAAIPIVSPSSTPEERYQAFTDYLRGQGVRYRTLSESSVILGYDSGILDVGFVSERTLKRGLSLSSEADVVRFGQIFFPELKRIQARLRPEQADVLTATERNDKQKRERAQTLWDETQADPAVQEICERLDGSVESVTPLSGD